MKKFILIPQKYFQSLNHLHNGDLSSISCLVVLLLSYYIRSQFDYKIRNKAAFKREFDLDLIQLSRYFFSSLQYKTCKARFMSALTELEFFKYISYREISSAHLKITFSEEILDLMLPPEKRKNDLWFSIPLVLFTNPLSVLPIEQQKSLKNKFEDDPDKVNEFLFKKLKGNSLLLLIGLMGQHCNNWIIHPEDLITDEVSSSNNRCLWDENLMHILGISGLECSFSSSNKQNTESHRFYRALKLLSELGFLSHDAVKSKLGRIIYVSKILLCTGISNLSRLLNSGRKQAYKEGILLNKQKEAILKSCRLASKAANTQNSYFSLPIYDPSPG